ncbi:MAG TPA: NADH-quinone oxidoreductase subunit B family protein [Candidatus Bathyarchaeia archaeon]|nr:NADH-quinone oxidoreductase subunit B family protein [Candidatus Bathyarchaeia archaeon]
MKKLVTWARIKSPWIIHFNTGACNACDIEIVAALTPRFDIERFGILLKGTPRHADVLVCSGPVTRQIQDRLVRIYEQMPEPKFVVAVGTCSCSGGVFAGCYNVRGGIDAVLPVSVYIPGCPASPAAIIDGVVKLLTSLEGKKLLATGPERGATVLSATTAEDAAERPTGTECNG